MSGPEALFAARSCSASRRCCNLPVLTFSPVLGLVSGMVFLVKAGILSGAFYVQAAVLFATAGVMAVWPATGLPNISISIFGIVSAACFFVPGLKYYRQRSART